MTLPKNMVSETILREYVYLPFIVFVSRYYCNQQTAVRLQLMGRHWDLSSLVTKQQLVLPVNSHPWNNVCLSALDEIRYSPASTCQFFVPKS